MSSERKAPRILGVGIACLEFASAAAALSCRELGGRNGIPTLAQTLGFLRARGAADWAS